MAIPQEVMDEAAEESLDGVLEAIRTGKVKREAFPELREGLRATRSKFEDAIENMKELIKKIDMIEKEISRREVK